MLKILERSITLQLLILYCLFLLPLLLGGIELYFFEHDAVLQSSQQADAGLTQAVAFAVEANIQATSEENSNLAATQASREHLVAQLMTIRQRLTTSNDVDIWIVDENGRVFAGTDRLFETQPNLQQSLRESSGSLIAHQQGRDWSYTFLSLKGTPWKVVVGRPVDVILAPVISFQHSLIIALIVLVIGASLFWVAMHGWVVAPLSRLAHAVKMIKPDQTVKVTESKLIARERTRKDEIGQLVTAFSAMEDEIHDLFRKSDQRSQARLHTLDAIMQSMKEGVLLESPQGQIVYANRSYTQFVGLSPQEMHLEAFNDNHLAEKMLALALDPDVYREALSQIEQVDGPQVVTFQTRGYYNQVGQLVPVRRDIRMQHFEVRDRAGQLIGRGKIFNDVTRQNEAEQLKKNLLAIVSHELRTPLTAIKGYATSLLETDVKLEDAVQERFLQRIVEEGDRMAGLVTNLLEMSQLEAGTLKFFPALCRLDALLEQAVLEDEYQYIQVHLPADLPLLYVDQRRMEMVLRNVIENAKRYAGPETIIEITARYKKDQADDGLYLSIADNGPGLPAHLTERIFDHFYQVDGGRERNRGGVGLGLAICRGFVNAHGGRIWAENRTDGVSGAIFHIWLPAKVLRTTDPQSSIFELHNAL